MVVKSRFLCHFAKKRLLKKKGPPSLSISWIDPKMLYTLFGNCRFIQIRSQYSRTWLSVMFDKLLRDHSCFCRELQRLKTSTLKLEDLLNEKRANAHSTVYQEDYNEEPLSKITR